MFADFIAPVAPIPSPPPSAGFDSDRFTEAKVGRGPPPAIDPSAANRAFLQPNMPTPANSVHLSPLPVSPAPPSTVRPSPHSLTDDSVFSFPMPGNRSPTEVRTQSPMMDRTAFKSQPPVSSPAQELSLMPENIQLPPSPMPPKSPVLNHHREDSAVSNSSYRTSFASSRYGDSTTRSSSNSLSRGFRSFMDDIPPVPLAPLRTTNNTSLPRDSNVSVVSSPITKEEANGFDFGIPRTDNPTTGLQNLPEEPPSAQFQDHTQYIAFNPLKLHPAIASTEPGSDAPRKNSNASMTSEFSVTSFARALGLDDQMNNSESSGSDSSASDARSGSSMSSLPSDFSLNRHNPTDPLNLKTPAQTRQTVLEVPGRILGTMEGVPPIPAAFFSPDSPTDPSINQGGVSLIAERKEVPPIPTPAQPKQTIPRKPPPQRSFTSPLPQSQPPTTPTRSPTRTKGKYPSARNTTMSAMDPFAPDVTPVSRASTWKLSSGTLHGQIAVDSTPTACSVVHVTSFSRATTSSGMVKSSAKEMLAELLLSTTHHPLVLLFLLVLLVVAVPIYPRLPSPSPANSLRVHTLHMAQDLDMDMDSGLALDSTPVPDSPLEVEDGSLNDGLPGL
ncbi:hypothetical protein PITC_037230 [Penicillium italicum]|uniref:Uncharacterized protein n=1 Tax=Penicillium italicum TaxID=40296 RepID=A0A0A2L877_PENIT|nr:hypothetical protein PITC_037230 [Penicillium italicum]